MEHIIKLNEYANQLRDYANQVVNAKDTTSLDEAKLAGLKIYQETLRETNRAFQEFTNLAREARGRVTQANFVAAREAARPVAEEAYVEVPPVEEPKPKKAKKAKKAKK